MASISRCENAFPARGSVIICTIEFSMLRIITLHLNPQKDTDEVSDTEGYQSNSQAD